MKAVIYEKYGPPEVLRLADVEKPVPGKDELLVKVKATTVTAGDWRMRKADPFLARIFNGLLKPRRIKILGFEISGIVEETGKDVKKFKNGDEIFASCGFSFGGYAEYKCLNTNNMIAHKPGNISFAEAAALPIGGVSALTGIKQGNIRKGQSVLINGASGSVGTYAVQIASNLGAEITAVCSSGNFDLVKKLGAAHCVDYRKENILETDKKYGMVFDAVGRLMSGISPREFKRILKPGGVFGTVETNKKSPREAIDELAEMVKEGKIKPVIDRIHTLDEIVEAHRYVEQGHKKGNVVIKIS